MATIASQIILHPVVSQGLKFGGTTLGRDKTYRALQYFSRFFAWYLINKGDKIEAARWSALKAHLGTARKLMRLGKPMEHLQAALRAAFSSSPALETITTIARQLGYFGYLSYDAIVWASTIKLINVTKETAARVQKRAFQFWVAGIAFSLIHGALKSLRLAKESKALKASKTWGEKDLAEEASRETRVAQITAARNSNNAQLALDIFDVWIPASGAGLVNLSEGTLGIAGLISSLLGAKAQWQSVNGKK
ncbi:peroxisomal biogenesis factor 11 [Crepidotus variabilis]|uniref:Peroxisomal biogenesis factor 11 n=1 Tax=Crepidotus variabilis TaxID=179855 RepID=A0A9P6JT80_9AGAR|nr:peroxisomal biogenesis factor 11 [Crepidotus variabilis]